MTEEAKCVECGSFPGDPATEGLCIYCWQDLQAKLVAEERDKKRADDDGIVCIRASDVKPKPAPVCEACGLRMWWHGGTSGWGCPDVHEGSPGCRSTLYRPKRGPGLPAWPYEVRYPELAGERGDG